MDVQYKDHRPFSNDLSTCLVCKKHQAKYLCPKCKTGYCDSRCYKNHNEECVEEFYKSHVLDNLTKKCDKEEIMKIKEIIERVRDCPDPVLDEMMMERKEKRLNEIYEKCDENLPEEILDPDELKEFYKFVRSGQVAEDIEWIPWWVDEESWDVESVSQSTEYFELVSVFKLNKNPSNMLMLHVIEIVYVVVYAWRFYNGKKEAFYAEITEFVMKNSAVVRGKANALPDFESLFREIIENIQRQFPEGSGLVETTFADCALILDSKWSVLKMIFEIRDFFIMKKVRKFFYADCKGVEKKLMFFASYVKDLPKEKFDEIVEEFREYCEKRQKVREAYEMLNTKI